MLISIDIIVCSSYLHQKISFLEVKFTLIFGYYLCKIAFGFYLNLSSVLIAQDLLLNTEHLSCLYGLLNNKTCAFLKNANFFFLKKGKHVTEY